MEAEAKGSGSNSEKITSKENPKSGVPEEIMGRVGSSFLGLDGGQSSTFFGGFWFLYVFSSSSLE